LLVSTCYPFGCSSIPRGLTLLLSVPVTVLSPQVLHQLHRSQIPGDGVHPQAHSGHVTRAKLRAAFRLVVASVWTMRRYRISPLSPLYENLGTVSVRYRHYASYGLFRLHRSEVTRESVRPVVRTPHSARTALRTAYRLLTPVERTKRSVLGLFGPNYTGNYGTVGNSAANSLWLYGRPGVRIESGSAEARGLFGWCSCARDGVDPLALGSLREKAPPLGLALPASTSFVGVALLHRRMAV